MSLLSLDHVTYSYPQATVPALADVSLSLAAGEFCVLAGLSGSGKSTVLRAAAGLVPHFHGGVFAGTVRVAGLDTRRHGPAEIGRVAGTLLQDPETQVVMSSVRSELTLAVENRGLSPAAVARAVEEAALALGIAHLLDRRTAELSGGELQRVALAAALAARPPLVLLDEPTSQLDPVVGDELIWQLRRLNQEADTAVLLVEHRLERCLAAADRVIVMRDGAVACDDDAPGFLRWAREHEPALQTPAAQLLAELGLDPPHGVKQARASLRAAGLLPGADGGGRSRSEVPFTGWPSANVHASGEGDPAGVTSGRHPPSVRAAPAEPAPPSGKARRRGRRSVRRGRPRERTGAALRMHGVWHEIRDGPAVLRGVDLELRPGEAVVLMGRNGAGKSTLLRHAAGLLAPTRGSVDGVEGVSLLLQNPGDYFLRDRVAEEAPAHVLAPLGLSGVAERHPRDLSGGQRQRLALAIILGEEPGPPVIALDEPTRGMDRAAKNRLAERLRERAARGDAVVVATHDAEFAAGFAGRAVLLADGRVIADGPIAQVLAGGWYFATETARILGGFAGALTPEQGVAALRAPMAASPPSPARPLIAGERSR